MTQADLRLQPVLPKCGDLSPVGMPLSFSRPCPGHRPQGTGQGTDRDQREWNGLEEKRKSSGELKVSPSRPGGLEKEQGDRESAAQEKRESELEV